MDRHADADASDDAIYREVGKKIQRARSRQLPKKTQQQLAADVGLERTSITNIEHGRQKFLLHTLIRIAEALQVSAEDLLPDVLPKMDNPEFSKSLTETLPMDEQRFVQGGMLGNRTNRIQKKRSR